MQRTSLRFDPDTLGDQDRARVHRRVLFGMIAAGVAFLGLMLVIPRPEADDIAGAQSQTTTARVTHVVYAIRDMDRAGGGFYVDALELDGRRVSLENALIPQELKVGQQVRVAYRQGKSGRWYLQSIQPE